jgi:hypothetical protein
VSVSKFLIGVAHPIRFRAKSRICFSQRHEKYNFVGFDNEFVDNYGLP